MSLEGYSYADYPPPIRNFCLKWNNCTNQQIELSCINEVGCEITKFLRCWRIFLLPWPTEVREFPSFVWYHPLHPPSAVLISFLPNPVFPCPCLYSIFVLANSGVMRPCLSDLEFPQDQYSNGMCKYFDGPVSGFLKTEHERTSRSK